MIGTVALAALGLISLAAVLYAAMRRLKPGDTFGSAGFGPWPGGSAGKDDPALRGLVLGRREDGRLAHWDKEGHLLMVAPTGAGKSTGVLMPTLKRWGGSCMAIDVKGELAAACAPALSAKGVRCFRFDPFDVLDDSCGAEKVGLDPVAQAAGSSSPLESFRRLAEVLIDPPRGDDAHWSESARVALAGLVAASSAMAGQKKTGLAAVADMCADGFGALSYLGKMDFPEEDVKPLVTRSVKLLEDSSPNMRAGILSTVSRQLAFLASKEVAASVTGSWDPAGLLDEGSPAFLFVVLPPQHLTSHGRLLRLVTASVVEAMLAAGTSRERRLLLAVDEAAALGRMEAIEQGVGLYRGYGATFLLSFQDGSQMDSVYGREAARSIRSNCNAVYWSVRDLETCRLVSEMLGVKTVAAATREIAKVPLGGSGESGQREAARPLLTPDELQRLPASEILCFMQGCRPTKLTLVSPEEALAMEAKGPGE